VERCGQQEDREEAHARKDSSCLTGLAEVVVLEADPLRG